MPLIATFGGILVYMYYNDHNPPHFHAQYGPEKALVEISSGEIIAGKLPAKIARLITTWALANNAPLRKNWERARAHRSLEKIGAPNARS